MMRFLILGALVLCTGTLWAFEEREAPEMVLISDAEGELMVGGGCGNKWKSGKVGCAGGGTNLCNGNATSCSDAEFDTLVPDGDGNEKKKPTTPSSCRVCGSTCGQADVVKKTEPCSSS